MQERSIHNVGPLPDGGIETLENSKSRPQRDWNKISEEIGSAGSPSPKNQNQNSNQSRFYQAVGRSGFRLALTDRTLKMLIAVTRLRGSRGVK
jgi:hypothetical protein